MTFPYLLELQRRALMRIIKEKELRELEEIDRMHGKDREAQIYALTRMSDNTYKFNLPETTATDLHIDGEFPNERYHDRIFPKDYQKKKKARRRQQKLSRRKH